MSLVATPAVVLQTFRYSETSKIVRLATRELGVQSAIAKGALRPKSPFGASLEFLSEGVAQLYYREQRDLQTLAGFDVTQLRNSLAHELPRFAGAAVLAEVMLRMAPAASLPQAYDTLRAYLDLLVAAPAESVEAVALRALWRLVTDLGFGPALRQCVRDGASIEPNATVAFSTAEGGVMCARCARAETAPPPLTRLRASDYRDLRALADDTLEIPDLDGRHATSHRRLVARFIEHHGGEARTFPALDAWERHTWAAAS